MIIKIDEKDDALYFRLTKDQIVESEEVNPNTILDFNKEGQVVGIEILNIKERGKIEEIKKLEYEAV